MGNYFQVKRRKKKIQTRMKDKKKKKNQNNPLNQTRPKTKKYTVKCVRTMCSLAESRKQSVSAWTWFDFSWPMDRASMACARYLLTRFDGWCWWKLEWRFLSDLLDLSVTFVCRRRKKWRQTKHSQCQQPFQSTYLYDSYNIYIIHAIPVIYIIVRSV